VNPACRGQGIGSRLMQAFEAAAARQQYDRVALIVSSDNPRARKLYMSKGYVSDGQIDIAGADYDHMVKRL
ncbi:GNAT family N-acetyltransferase, partial [Paenibacillus sepulcri]|nr:GNAT family N-acetyltransferase [Paenibacillus sepulcri]